jgi:hypothetical protein
MALALPTALRSMLSGAVPVWQVFRKEDVPELKMFRCGKRSGMEDV